MSTVLKTIAVAPLKAAATVEPLSRRRIDQIDELARPLGAKRAALQMRRKRSAGKPRQPKSASDESGVLTLTSRDETVAFTLTATSLGLVLERTQRQVVGTRLIQVIVFTDQPAFDRWCAFEPMRFEDGLLYSQLRREGHAALTART
jgi:hypothetical protein